MTAADRLDYLFRQWGKTLERLAREEPPPRPAHDWMPVTAGDVCRRCGAWATTSAGKPCPMPGATP